MGSGVGIDLFDIFLQLYPWDGYISAAAAA